MNVPITMIPHRSGKSVAGYMWCKVMAEHKDQTVLIYGLRAARRAITWFLSNDVSITSISISRPNGVRVL